MVALLATRRILSVFSQCKINCSVTAPKSARAIRISVTVILIIANKIVVFDSREMIVIFLSSNDDSVDDNFGRMITYAC